MQHWRVFGLFRAQYAGKEANANPFLFRRWRRGLSTMPRWQINVHDGIGCAPLRVAESFADRRKDLRLPPTADVESLVMITACSADYFGALRNFVGSMHLLEPHMSIIVYDLGLLYLYWWSDDVIVIFRLWSGMSICRLVGYVWAR